MHVIPGAKSVESSAAKLYRMQFGWKREAVRSSAVRHDLDRWRMIELREARLEPKLATALSALGPHFQPVALEAGT